MILRPVKTATPSLLSPRGLRPIAMARGSLGWTPYGFDLDALEQAQILSSTTDWLTDGGDERIVCGARGHNRYGCAAIPENDVLPFGSSTASTISPASFAAAEALRDRLQAALPSEPAHVIYERELTRVRRDLTDLCGLGDLPGLEIIFGASGTDLHLFASQIMVEMGAPAPLIVRVEAGETGRGVPDALAGRHFSDCAALGQTVAAKAPLDCGRAIQILEVKCRTAEGKVRSLSAIDAEVEAGVARAVFEGRRVLLTLVDVSKTGLLVPSIACVDKLHARFPKAIDVLVDACQFRCGTSTLRAYLERDFLVAITGSKFVTGPTFCGALLVPLRAAKRFQKRFLPGALSSYSNRADWPRHWTARAALPSGANFGLLLRWEAALTELRAFRDLPEPAVADFLKTFASAVTEHLAANPAFEFVPAPRLHRAPLATAPSWDSLPTIFTFLLKRRTSFGPSVWLDSDETKRVHELLREEIREAGIKGPHAVLSRRCQLGQPVNCGQRDGLPVTGLRLCASSRLVVDALSPTGRGTDAVIADALTALDKAALLATSSLL
jgi:hypothetical protein